MNGSLIRRCFTKPSEDEVLALLKSTSQEVCYSDRAIADLLGCSTHKTKKTLADLGIKGLVMCDRWLEVGVNSNDYWITEDGRTLLATNKEQA